MNVNRVRHLENAISHSDRNNSISDLPRVSIDSHLRSYYRAHKTKITNEDKEWLSSKFKDIFKWRGLIQHFTKEPADVSGQLRTYFGNHTWRSYTNSKAIPEHTRLSMPEPLYRQLLKHHGKEKSADIGNLWNEKAPTFLRVNPLVDDRDRVVKFLSSKGISVDKTETSPLGLRMSRSEKLESLPELADHVFDMQDESCQIVGMQVAVKPGDKVIDYCCGSGGKSLVFGPSLQGKGHLYLHDVNGRYLTQAKKKMRAARIKNFSALVAGCPQTDLLRRRMDWVLVDAPSTGSGQYRRYPDRKWLFSDELLESTVETQRMIFKEALRYLKKSGKIVYSTASIFPEENLEQVKYFCNQHGLYLTQEPVHSLPQSHGMDGFFCAVLERQ